MGEWSDLPRRLLTVSIGAPFIVLMLANPISSHLLFQAVHLCCVLEWLHLKPNNNDKLLSIVFSKKETEKDHGSSRLSGGETQFKCNCLKLFPIVSILAVYIPSRYISVYTTIIASAIFLSAYIDMEHVCKRERFLIQSSAAHAIHGVLFLSIPFHYWVLLSKSSFSHTVFLLFTVWNTDTGALIAGRVGKMCFSSHDIIGDLFGTCDIGRRLVGAMKKISPSKSMTGFCGGILFGTMTAYYLPDLIVHMFGKGGIFGMGSVFIGKYTSVDVNLVTSSGVHVGILDFETVQWIGAISLRRLVMGFILSCCAIVGDLVESCVKRNAGKKDSGKLLPGHGGILDRFDSTFLAVPVYIMFIRELY